jgi:hypothetical protein
MWRSMVMMVEGDIARSVMPPPLVPWGRFKVARFGAAFKPARLLEIRRHNIL